MQKHLIFTSGRSGSNYLSNTLNLSPQCLNYGEVLGDWTLPQKYLGRFFRGKDQIAKYLDIVYANPCYFELAQIYSAYSHWKGNRPINYKRRPNLKSIGIKDFLVTMETRDCADYFLNDTSIKVIYLHRDNILQRYVSGLFMRSSGVAASYQKVNAGMIALDVPDMFKHLGIYAQEAVREKAFIAKLTSHEVLEIEYQGYFASPEATQQWNKRIFEFLELAPIAELSQQKKILANTLKDIVTNYDELRAAIRGSEYEKFLY